MSPELLSPAVPGIGTYWWDPVAQELSWDEMAATIFAADPALSALEVWHTRVHPGDRERVLHGFSQSIKGEELYRLVMDDGSLRHVLTRVTAVVEDPDTGVRSATGVILDVSAGRRSEVMLSSMLDSISDGVIVLDFDYRILYLNQQAAVVLGTEVGLVPGKGFWDVFPDAGDLFRSSYAKTMNERVPVTFEAFYPAPLNRWFEARAQPSSDGILIYFQDVTERHRQQDEREALRQELAYQASHDSLTDLMNRAAFEKVLAERLASRRSDQRPVTVLFLDLDRFKLINDSLGHAVGDALLVTIAARITTVVGSDAAAARLGGDEFVVLLGDLPPEAVQSLCDRLLEELRVPAQLGEYTVMTTVSIGVASADCADEALTLLRNADVALYRAKDAGRNRSAWFDADAHQTLLDRILLEADLRTALDAGTIGVHYQPIYSLTDGRMCGVEALARWYCPERGSISPEIFIPLAEDAGLINRLGRHVARTAIAQARQWNHIPDFRVWVNVSGRQFSTSTSTSTDDILSDFTDSGVRPERLGVEVTESVLADETVAVHALRILATKGVGVAIDDFGTGYSSIARLGSLPTTVLKIDRSFIAGLDTPQGRSTLDLIVHLAHTVGMTTTAEGIETPEQLELVRKAGVTTAQGYLLGRPAPSHQLIHSTRI